MKQKLKYLAGYLLKSLFKGAVAGGVAGGITSVVVEKYDRHALPEAGDSMMLGAFFGAVNSVLPGWTRSAAPWLVSGFVAGDYANEKDVKRWHPQQRRSKITAAILMALWGPLTVVFHRGLDWYI